MAGELAVSSDLSLTSDEIAFLDQVDATLRNLVSLGTAHASEAGVEEMLTLAVSARGEHLPRLAAALNNLAGDLRRLVDREFGALPEKSFRAAARLAALTAALRAAKPECLKPLRGQYRAAYTEIGSLELVPVVGHRWSTSGGREGVTLLFWAPKLGNWLSWSTPRIERAGMDPAKEFGMLGPWPGTIFASDAGRRRLRIGEARISLGGRLSASSRVTAQRLDQAWMEAGDRFGAADFDDWRDLRAYAAAQMPIGLVMPSSDKRIVVVRPSRWGSRWYDERAQRLVWNIYDADDQIVRLIVPYTAVTQKRIEALENLDLEDREWAIVASLLHGGPEGFALLPLGMLSLAPTQEFQVLNLDFLSSAVPSMPVRARLDMSHHEEIPHPALAALRPFGQWLAELSETGLRGGLTERMRKDGERLARRARTMGIDRLANGFDELLAAPHHHFGDLPLRIGFQANLLEALAFRTIIAGKSMM